MNDAAEEPRFANHLLLRKDSVEFRSYQNSISQSAFSKNTLVILPTALGKTVISLFVCANTLYTYRDKRVLIMAPTRPLVTQHMNSFFSVLKIFEDQIAEVTGKITPAGRRAIWKKQEIRLVFATPEVVKNDIQENRLSLTDFTLLVFDEAHRAVKDYAYSYVAKEYVKQSVYPIVLALTASPGSDKQRIQEVCDNLFIEQIEYRNEEDPDVKGYINPIEVKWEWFDLPSDYQYIRSILKGMLDEKIKWLVQHKLLRKDSRWIFKRDLINIGDQIRYNLELTMEEQRGPLYVALMQQSSSLSLMYCSELIESQGSYSLKAFLDRIEEEGGKSHQTLLNDPRIKEIKTLVNKLTTQHPKLMYIVDHLRNRYQISFKSDHNAGVTRHYQSQKREQFELIPSHKERFASNLGETVNTLRVLIFTQYRDTARYIVEVLSENGIKASRFVGQAKRQGDPGMKQDEQSSILESFRNGEFDVLVATSIAEEGLDIPEVELVIFYEPIPSEIRYIQRRGRTGRKSAGTVLILAAKETIDERHLNASKRRVQKMKQILSTLGMTLKPFNRNILTTNPLTVEELKVIDTGVEKMDTKFKKEVELNLLPEVKNIPSQYVSNHVNKIIRNKRKSLLILEEERLTSQFRRQVDKTARMIHSLLSKSGKDGLDFDSISEDVVADNAVLLEALHRLEKLKRIEWIDDSTVVLVDNLKKISGKIYYVYIEKILQGEAVVIVDGKWHARLSHYDYDGPRNLLKKGSEFKAVGELYQDNGVLNLRIKQIV
jgi:ERCC4-related helicase